MPVYLGAIDQESAILKAGFCHAAVEQSTLTAPMLWHVFSMTA